MLKVKDIHYPEINKLSMVFHSTVKIQNQKQKRSLKKKKIRGQLGVIECEFQSAKQSSKKRISS